MSTKDTNFLRAMTDFYRKMSQELRSYATAFVLHSPQTTVVWTAQGSAWRWGTPLTGVQRGVVVLVTVGVAFNYVLVRFSSVL